MDSENKMKTIPKISGILSNRCYLTDKAPWCYTYNCTKNLLISGGLHK